MENHSLTLADALKCLREDIQAENTLISSRVTWYVTSQAFLLTAYATSWNSGFMWPYFFHHILPFAAIALSALILSSICAATWAQNAYLREQAIVVARMKKELSFTPSESLALHAYERTMVANRTNPNGRIVGGRIHVLVLITPIILPIGFSVLWLYAYFFAPLISR